MSGEFLSHLGVGGCHKPPGLSGKLPYTLQCTGLPLPPQHSLLQPRRLTALNLRRPTPYKQPSPHRRDAVSRTRAPVHRVLLDQRCGFSKLLTPPKLTFDIL